MRALRLPHTPTMAAGASRDENQSIVACGARMQQQLERAHAWYTRCLTLAAVASRQPSRQAHMPMASNTLAASVVSGGDARRQSDLRSKLKSRGRRKRPSVKPQASPRAQPAPVVLSHEAPISSAVEEPSKPSVADVLSLTAADADAVTVARRLQSKTKGAAPSAGAAFKRVVGALDAAGMDADEASAVRRGWSSWSVGAMRRRGVEPFEWHARAAPGGQGPPLQQREWHGDVSVAAGAAYDGRKAGGDAAASAGSSAGQLSARAATHTEVHDMLASAGPSRASRSLRRVAPPAPLAAARAPSRGSASPGEPLGLSSTLRRTERGRSDSVRSRLDRSVRAGASGAAMFAQPSPHRDGARPGGDGFGQGVPALPLGEAGPAARDARRSSGPWGGARPAAFTATEALELERQRRGPTPRRGADADVDSCAPRGPLRRGDGRLPNSLQCRLV